LTDVSDVELMAQLAQRDPHALRMLYERYSRIAFALAYRVTSEATTAEEIVQDAFETVWNKATTFDPGRGGNVRGWLLTIVHRKAIDNRRRVSGKTPRPVPIDAMLHILALPDAWAEVSADLLAVRVRTALGNLPPDQHRIIDLAFFEGCSQSEIAARESLPLGTVKSRMRLGMRKLAELLRDERDTTALATGEGVLS